MKEIEKPEALDIDEFSALYEGIALRNLITLHSGKEKVTLDDLFLLHSMVGTQDEGAADAEDDEECVDATSNMSITNRLRAWMKDWGMNFMSSTPVYSTTPSHSPSPNPFGLFGDTDAGPSTSQNQGNDMNED
ncbi:hypothetical protein Tco_0471755 [Tanacetum coccineum]